MSQIEKPMLFSGPMVRAILEDRKTQTRRIAKLDSSGRILGTINGRRACWHPDDAGLVKYAPHPIGSRIWVKETHAYGEDADGPYVLYCADNTKNYSPIELSAAFLNGFEMEEHSDFQQTLKRPSIHMPRWASRIDNVVTNVRVERLNDISEDDAKAEGIDTIEFNGERFTKAYIPVQMPQGGEIVGFRMIYSDCYRKSYRTLWESINGKGSWELNPLVFVYEFRRVKP